MKRIIILALALLMLLSLCACGTGITKEQAKNIACRDSQADQISVSQLTATLDKSSDPPVYVVKFMMHATWITYRIDANTGDILSRDPAK